MKRTVLAIGRWMPIHNGHKSFLVKLAREFDHLVIGIGSCYENGTARNCIPAIEREKLLRRVLKAEGIDDTRVSIIPVEDRETFEAWIADVIEICNSYSVTHFCTGNKEDILNVLVEKGIKLDLEMINPEDGSDFPYHATDIRNAIINGEGEKLDSMIPHEIKDMVLKQVSKEIIAASKGRGKHFILGRQTVDTVFLCEEKDDHYLLCGTRDGTKKDFSHDNAIPGGGIKPYESPINAAIRTLEAESGIKIELLDNSCEPAKVYLPQLDLNADMHFVSIYASDDVRVNGTLGGGSQCFALVIRSAPEAICQHLASCHDLVDLRFVSLSQLSQMTFAYEQKRMVYDALDTLGIDYGQEYLAVLDDNGNTTGEKVSRRLAHADGIIHGAAHTFIYKKEGECFKLLLQRRSANKDSYALCLDISSAGHMECGMDYDTTAVKELEEELGIVVKPSELKRIAVLKTDDSNYFHGEVFLNREFYALYLLEADIDPATLTLQPEEVAEALWLDLDYVLDRVKNNDPEFSLAYEELSAVAKAITK